MNDKDTKQINALKTAAKNKRLAAQQRIEKAFEEMEKTNIPITFQSVAKHAQVSKTILYADAEISEKIKKCRDKGSILQRMLDQQTQLNKKDHTISNLKKRVEYLNSEVKRLKYQIEITYGELYTSNVSHNIL